MILNDREIIFRHIITPIRREHQNPFGYDLTLGTAFLLPCSQAEPVSVVGGLPKYTCFSDEIVLPSGSYALGVSEEYIRVPKDVLGLCFSRSSLVRLGLNVNITPLEAGWEGQITIEMFNAAPYPLKVPSGIRIAQVIFLSGNEPELDYVKKGGRYQGQVGIIVSKGA